MLIHLHGLAEIVEHGGGVQGRRLVAKYSSAFLLKDRAAQKTFEDKLFSKTKNAKLGSDSDVVMLDRKIIVFKARADRRTTTDCGRVLKRLWKKNDRKYS